MNKKEDIEELKKLAKPLQEWLTSHFNPMCSIVINDSSVMVISKEIGTPTELN